MGILGETETEKEERIMDKQGQIHQDSVLMGNLTDTETEKLFLDQQKDKEDLVRWQQDLQPEILQMEHDLRREVINDNGKFVPMEMFAGYDDNKKPIFQEVPPVCNDLAIMMIKTNLRPLMSRNVMMSNFSEERILQMLRSTMKTIIRNICVNHDYYEVSFHDISYIRQTVQNAVLPGPYRALNNGERKHLTTINRRIESHSEMPQKKGSPGLFDYFKR